MRNFVLGTIFGIVVSTIGFSGIAKLIDNGITKVKQVTVEHSQE